MAGGRSPEGLDGVGILALREVIGELQTPSVLIVVDTLARSMIGAETPILVGQVAERQARECGARRAASQRDGGG